ncbi:MAG: cytochrome-c peroxidase [Polyangiaceae bacterium]
MQSTLRPWMAGLLALVLAACFEKRRSFAPEVDDAEPDWRPVQVAAVRPFPLSGGTLTILDDGARALVAEPDRSRVVIVSLTNFSVEHTIALEEGSEPGRSVEDSAGHVYVALRSGGAVAILDPASGSLLKTTPVCAAPRGLAYETATNLVHVVCAGGELVSIHADDGTVARTVMLEPDLRDVVTIGDHLLVSRMRSAEVLTVRGDGTIARRDAPSSIVEPDEEMEHEPEVAWRLVQVPGTSQAMMIHQMARVTPINLQSGDTAARPDYYSTTSCQRQLVQYALTVFDGDGSVATYQNAQLSTIGLGVDLAIRPDNTAVAALDARRGEVIELDDLGAPGYLCGSALAVGGPIVLHDEAVAIAYAPSPDDPTDQRLVVQTRQPDQVFVYFSDMSFFAIALGGADTTDTGYELFHDIGATTSSGLACASCHPEGRDDGHVWHFEGLEVGARRTQSLAGTLDGTAPFHWQGDLGSLNALMKIVFEHRMGGLSEPQERVDALETWLENIQPNHVGGLVDTAAVERGRALFQSEQVGCSKCHSGPMLTNNLTMDVGTGRAFQVPSLIGVGVRAPFMHDGCATTLMDKFDPTCGGDERHGNTADLTSAQQADLVSYMNTL